MLESCEGKSIAKFFSFLYRLGLNHSKFIGTKCVTTEKTLYGYNTTQSQHHIS